MLFFFRDDADGNKHHVAAIPDNAIRELKDLNAGFENDIRRGFRQMWQGDAIPKKVET